MRRMAFVVLMFSAGLCAAQGANTEPLAPIETVSLAGVEGRIDHMALDVNAQRFFIAALGNNTVEVVDVKNWTRAGTIEGLKEPQGIAVIPESHTMVVASGEDGMCRFYDPSNKLIGSLSGMDDADNVRYDPVAKRVYVGYGSGALAVIDPTGPTKIGETKLDGHPESFQLEKEGGRIFVNVPTAHQIAVIDKSTGAVVARWPVDQAKSNFPMALDERNHRVFVGCRAPAKLLVFDTESGKVVASTACCGDTDDVFYDAARKRIYVSGGEGCVTVIEQADPDNYRPAGKLPTASGARTSYFEPVSGRLYVAVPHRGKQPAEARVYQAQP